MTLLRSASPALISKGTPASSAVAEGVKATSLAAHGPVRRGPVPESSTVTGGMMASPLLIFIFFLSCVVCGGLVGVQGVCGQWIGFESVDGSMYINIPTQPPTSSFFPLAAMREP